MNNLPCVGDLWKHIKKGTEYVIMRLDWDAEGEELSVRVEYGPLEGGPIFSRGLRNFLVRDDLSPRFERIEKGKGMEHTCDTCCGVIDRVGTASVPQYCIRCGNVR